MAHFTQLPNEILIIIFKFVFNFSTTPNELFDFYNLRKISRRFNGISKAIDTWKPYVSNLNYLHKKNQWALKNILQEQRTNKQLDLFLEEASQNEFFANIAIRDKKMKQLLSEKCLNEKIMDVWVNGGYRVDIIKTLLKYESTAIFSLQYPTFRKVFLNKNFSPDEKREVLNYIIRCGLAHEFIATYIVQKDTELRKIIMKSSKDIVHWAIAHESIATHIFQKDIELRKIIMQSSEDIVRCAIAHKSIATHIFQKDIELRKIIMQSSKGIVRCAIAHEFIATHIFQKDIELRKILMESSENIVRCAIAHKSIATHIFQKDIELMQVIIKSFKTTIIFISAYKEIFVLFFQNSTLKQAFLNFLNKMSKLAGDAQLLNIGIRFEIFSKEQTDKLLDDWHDKSQEQIINDMIHRLEDKTAENQQESTTMKCCR